MRNVQKQMTTQTSPKKPDAHSIHDNTARAALVHGKTVTKKLRFGNIQKHRRNALKTAYFSRNRRAKRLIRSQQKRCKMLFNAVFCKLFIFYIITNFGVWLLGSYGYTLNGLFSSYILAIPFFGNTLISTILYALIIETIYKFFLEKKLFN